MRLRYLVLSVLLMLAGLALLAPVAGAQTAVVNPVTVEFTPSADHAVLALDGSPMVTKYEMRIFVETPLGPTPSFTTDIGKPTPVAGKITITNAVWFSGLTPNTRYVAKVAAVGPTGEGVSDPSNPFGNVGNPAKPTAVVVKK
jgi:hypothetical protein